MVKVNLLRGKIAEKGYKIYQLAPIVGMSTTTLSNKLNQRPGTFTQEEMEALIKVLEINNPSEIFFA